MTRAHSSDATFMSRIYIRHGIWYSESSGDNGFISIFEILSSPIQRQRHVPTSAHSFFHPTPGLICRTISKSEFDGGSTIELYISTWEINFKNIHIFFIRNPLERLKRWNVIDYGEPRGWRLIKSTKERSGKRIETKADMGSYQWHWIALNIM